MILFVCISQDISSPSYTQKSLCGGLKNLSLTTYLPIARYCELIFTAPLRKHKPNKRDYFYCVQKIAYLCSVL